MYKLKYKHNDQEVYGCDLDLEMKSLSDKLGDYEIEMVGSTEKVDRDGEVLKIEGWDLKNFKKNPMVLLNHDYFGLPIGKAKVSVEGKKLMFKIEFPPEGINPKADIVRGLCKAGFMKASSVGFIPKEWKDGQKESDPRRTFTKQELLEISLVTVPCNPDAIISAKSVKEVVDKGIVSIEQVEKIVDRIMGNNLEEKEEIEDTLMLKAKKAGLITNKEEQKSALGDIVTEEVNRQLNARMAQEATATAEAMERMIKNYEPIFIAKAISAIKEELEAIKSEINNPIKAIMDGDFGDSLEDKPSPDDIIGATQRIAEKIFGKK